MAQQWEESTININHVGKQELEQGDTYEKSDNILYNTTTNAEDYRTALLRIAEKLKKRIDKLIRKGEWDVGDAFQYGDNDTNEELKEAIEERMDSDDFNKELKKIMVVLHDGNHSKQIDGAAEIFELKTGQKPRDRRIKYEKIREASIESMRRNPVYQFCMLLAGYNNVKISKYWITPSESELRAQINMRKLDARANRERQDDGEEIDDEGDIRRLSKYNDEGFHRWFTSTAWADGMIHLSPTIYAHLEEAYAMVTKKWKHLSGVPLSKFIENMEVRGYFARLVTWNMRTSDVLSGQRYHLDSTYRRVNLEKAKVLNIFKNVHLEGGELVYRKAFGSGRYVNGTQTENNHYLDKKALIRRNPFLHYDNVLRSFAADQLDGFTPGEEERKRAVELMVENSKQQVKLYNNIK